MVNQRPDLSSGNRKTRKEIRHEVFSTCKDTLRCNIQAGGGSKPAFASFQKVGNTELTNRLRAELQAVSKPNIGLGKFESEKEVDELDIPALTERVQKAAPELWTLLASLMEPPRATSNRDAGTLKGSTVMICSILAYGRTPRKCNNLPMLLGLHLHSMGVKRRTINVLAGLGVTSSYRAINIKQEKLADIGKVLPSLFKFMCPTNPVEDKG